MNCEFCLIRDDAVDSQIIFEDDLCLAVLHFKPAFPGQVIIFPKNHHPILEQLPDAVIGHLFMIAKKISVSLFDSLQIHGTNILMQNGVSAGQTVSHVALEIIPRKENDGLNFQWKPIELSKDDIDSVFLLIKAYTENLHPSMFGKSFREKEKVESKSVEEEDSFLVRQLKRIP